jgi:hypothetical protein
MENYIQRIAEVSTENLWENWPETIACVGQRMIAVWLPSVARDFFFSTTSRQAQQITLLAGQSWRTYGSVSKMTTGDLSLTHGIQCCLNIFIAFCSTSFSVLWRTCVYMSVNLSDCLLTVYELPLVPYHTAVKYFYKNRPASWSRGQSLWLPIMRFRVRFPVLV